MRFLIIWQRLRSNPTNHNEFLSMELSWAWEPTYKKRTYIFGVGKGLFVVLIEKTWADDIRLKEVWYLKICSFFHEFIEVEDWLCIKGIQLMSLSKPIPKIILILSLIRIQKKYEGLLVSIGELNTSKRHDSWELICQLKK